jgi:signal transduction histidine kinase
MAELPTIGPRATRPAQPSPPALARRHAAPAPASAGLDLLPDAAVVLDAQGRVTYANRAALRLLRTGADAILGQPFEQVVELRDAAGNSWWPCTDRLRRLRAVRGVPPRLLTLTSGGEHHPVELAATFVRQDGKVTSTICTLRDGAGRRADADCAELISTLAHELRSPLTSVKGFSATLLHRWDRFTDEQKRHMLTTINADADRVTRLIKELLDVSRIEAGRLELKRELIDLPGIAKGVVERFRLTAPNHQLSMTFPAVFPEVYADPDKIEQVLTNLVENAVKYAEGGAVTVTGEATDDHVEVGVQDEGPGIAADQLPLIFTKFYRSKADHRSGTVPSGTGLGLYITKGLVEAHGGRVWAHSGATDGTEVRFLLPRGGVDLGGLGD